MNAALLIDAENFSYKHVQMLFEDLSKKENINVHLKLAFGDWTLNNLNNDNWKSTLNKLSIRPQHLFNYTQGKNASDIQLVIHAMNILHTNQDIDTFILATSDSDFTPLVLNLKEYNKNVIGYGCGSCSKTLFDSCDEYHILKEDKKQINDNQVTKKVIKTNKPTNAPKKSDSTQSELYTSAKCCNILREVWRQSVCDEFGWVTTNHASHVSKKVFKDFVPSKFGGSTLSDLIEKNGKFEIKRTPKDKHTEVSFRPKDRLSDKALHKIYSFYFKNYNKVVSTKDSSGQDVLGWLPVDVIYDEYKSNGLTAFNNIEDLKEALFQSNILNIDKDKNLFTFKLNKNQRKVGFLFLEAYANLFKKMNCQNINFQDLTNEVKNIESDFTASKYEIKQLNKFIQELFFFNSQYDKDNNQFYFSLKYKNE